MLSPEEVRRLLGAAPGFKYRLLLSLTYGCGLRASEVVSLKVCDIDSAQMVIRIEQGKGRKDRYVMLPPALLDMLRQWWKAARPQGWLFPGRPAVNPLTYRQLNRIFHLAAEAAEIRKGATLHTLRHSFATHLLESKLDIRMIQALLGHKRLDTTAHYTRVATDLISKVVSPLDQLGQEGQEGRAAASSHAALVPRPALEVADIFRDHGAAWREANRGHVSLGQLKVMSAIERCRTAALGGHVARCENDACGHTRHRLQ